MGEEIYGSCYAFTVTCSKQTTDEQFELVKKGIEREFYEQQTHFEVTEESGEDVGRHLHGIIRSEGFRRQGVRRIREYLRRIGYTPGRVRKDGTVRNRTKAYVTPVHDRANLERWLSYMYKTGCKPCMVTNIMWNDNRLF
jgi:hypothetical protein